MYTFAIIGCGNAAEKHAREIARIGKLVAVCDVVPSRAEALARTYGAASYGSIDELLKQERDVDIISICTPNGYHAEHSIKSLQAGKNVVCETPFCLTKAGAWQTIETEKFCRRRLLVTDPVAKHEGLKRIQASTRKTEEVKFELKCAAVFSDDYTNWRGRLFPGGGSLYTAFSAGISALVYLFGPIADVSGSLHKMNHNDSEIEGGGSAVLLMQNGAQGQIQWEFGPTETSVLTVRYGGKTETIDLSELAPPNHTSFYDELLFALDGKEHSLANLYEAAKTVEAIEKIYQKTSPNTSSDN